MNLIKKLTCCFILFFICAGLIMAEDRILFKDGEKAGKIQVMASEGRIYLQASKAAKILGGKINVLSASGKVVFKSRKLQVVFSEGSGSVSTNGVLASFDQPMLVRAGVPYISAEYFQSDVFAGAYGRKIVISDEKGNIPEEKSIAGTETAVFVPATDNPTVPGIPEITSIRCGTHTDKTRIVLNLSETCSWEEEHSDDIFLLRLAGAVVKTQGYEGRTGNEVMDISISGNENGAELHVQLSPYAGETKIFRLSSPERIVIDVFKAAGGGAASVPAESAEADNSISDNDMNVDIYPELKPLESAPAVEQIKDEETTVPVVTEEQRKGKRIIVIDPGHGGHDSGTHFDITKVTTSYKKNSKGKKVKVKNTKVIRTIKEKELNLLQAKELIKLINGDSRFKAVLTRDKDVFVSLPGRSKIAKNLKADAFISLHINSAGKNPNNPCKPHGFEIFSMTEDKMDSEAVEVAARENTVFSEEEREELLETELLQDSFLQINARNSGYILAENIAAEFRSRTPFPPNGSTGVKKANFAVLRRARFPAVLVESGFLCNSTDRPLLENAKTRKKIAEAVYNAIVKYGRNSSWYK
jgi:N-acetylmuramoyl-L-alanine amidase